MKQGYKMTPHQKEQRFRQTLSNQAEKMFNQQVSQPNPTMNKVDFINKQTKI